MYVYIILLCVLVVPSNSTCTCVPILSSSLQVRVRAGVQVSSDPLVYEFGQPTEWKLADSIVDVLPSPPRKQTHNNILYK